MIGAYPTADQVALAVVTAARLVDESPLAPERARYIAFAGLIEAYPDTPKRHLARLAFLGGGAWKAAPSNLQHVIRPAKWWRDEFVDEVTGALVTDEYVGE